MNALGPCAVSKLVPSNRHPAARRRRAPLAALRAWLALLAVFLLAGNAFAETTAATQYAGGNGSPGNPWQIATLAQLRLFMETAPASWPDDANFILTASIDAADTATWLSNAGWLPVDITFVDRFDGNGFNISNLHVNRPSTDNVGFFGQAGSACCQQLVNIKIVGGSIVGRDYVGGLLGKSGVYTTISTSSSTAQITGRASVGGLVGYQDRGTIESSSSQGTVTGTDAVGGLVGTLAGGTITSGSATGPVSGNWQIGGLVGARFRGSGSGVVTTSLAEGAVTGNDAVGGLIGYNDGKVTFSSASGSVTGSDVAPSSPGIAMVGGLIGRADTNSIVEDSSASGDVSGKLKNIGGLVGGNYGRVTRGSTPAGQKVTGIGSGSGFAGGLVGGNLGVIASSSAAGTVTVAGTVGAVGGLVGYQSYNGVGIQSSYATGDVTAAGANQVGGLVGAQATSGGTIADSYAQGQVSGLDSVGGLVGEQGGSYVQRSHATGAVSGAVAVGGLLGFNGLAGKIETTYATGTVTGTDAVGGLIGQHYGRVTASYATQGSVHGNKPAPPTDGGRWVGGLVGINGGAISSSYAANDVTGNSYVGGLVGKNSASGDNNTSNCFAKGAVTGVNYVGGLVGQNDSGSNIATCYASGTVAATQASPAPSVGGLIGDNGSSFNSNLYWNKDTAGLVGVGGFLSTAFATGLTSAQMLHQASFTGFAFPPWAIVEGVTQPYLNWMVAAPTISGAASRKTHAGAGTFNLSLALTPASPTTEPRQGPAATVVFTFDKLVNAATVTVTSGVATAAAPTFSGSEVIVGLTAVADSQYVTIALTNVSSTDGGAGGSASVRIGFLAGDVDGNRIVTLADVLSVNATLGQPTTLANFLRDVNLSGTVTMADRLMVNANLTQFLPAP